MNFLQNQHIALFSNDGPLLSSKKKEKPNKKILRQRKKGILGLIFATFLTSSA